MHIHTIIYTSLLLYVHTYIHTQHVHAHMLFFGLSKKTEGECDSVESGEDKLLISDSQSSLDKVL